MLRAVTLPEESSSRFKLGHKPCDARVPRGSAKLAATIASLVLARSVSHRLVFSAPPLVPVRGLDGDNTYDSVRLWG